MQSRKSSIVSTTSVRHRKFSATRLQRQAELSLLNEETPHLGGLSIDTKGKNVDSFENFTFQARAPTFASLSRSDTGGPSPFEAHPGFRMRGFSLSSFPWTSASVRGSFVKPFDEPDDLHGRVSGRRQTVLGRSFTGPVDIESAGEKSIPERRALYVLDFETSKFLFGCSWRSTDLHLGNMGPVMRGLPMAFDTTDGLQKYLNEVSTGPLRLLGY